MYAEKSDVDYLVTELQNYFPNFKRESIHYTYASLRPLVPKKKKSASNTSRAHRLIDHELQDGVKGFLSILGGKNTAYRGIAEEAVNLTVKKLGGKAVCTTAQTALPGAPEVSQRDIEKTSAETGLPPETIIHLAAIYGSQIKNVLSYIRADKRLGSPISPGGRDILVQIKHAIDEEEAMSVSDFMLRRSLIGLRPDQGLDALDTVTNEMAALLNWNDTEKKRQEADYRNKAALGQLYKQQER